MGDTTLAGTGGGAHAVEECITHGPEITELCEHYGISRKTGYK
jgi:hypothetical protein